MTSHCTTFLIVPAYSDQAGQCRIVSRKHHPSLRPSLVDYRCNPEFWREAGLMSSVGDLRCLDAPLKVHEDMKSNQPLAAPNTYTYDMDWNPA